MCSIIGYSGQLTLAAPLLVESLKKMEYRGYDSVGIATLNKGNILVSKGVGKVAEVDQQMQLNKLPGEIGIGHTRWATHGGVTDTNAHPHYSCSANIAVVHNGIIENYQELKSELEKEGHIFKSQTDSEVIAHLLERDYEQSNSSIVDAMTNTCKKIRGSFAFVAVFNNGVIAGARFDEPLIIGISSDALFLSSDVLGFLKYTDKAIFLDNGDIVIIEDKKYTIFDASRKNVNRPVTQVAWELGSADKGKFAHYTIKEIHEQSSTMLKPLEPSNDFETFCKYINNASNVYITGSGTSYNCGLLGKLLLSKFARKRTEVYMSSEFQYFSDTVEPDSVVIAISQSGETADVLHSVKQAKENGAKILSIVNIPTSSLARMSDCFVTLNCGPEIGVAATKSFLNQLMILYKIVYIISGQNIRFDSAELVKLQKSVQSVLDLDFKIRNIIGSLDHNVKDIYILGRSIHYPIALEGSLKIKELAYVHAEGIAAGELKHGPLALIDKESVVIVLNPNDETYRDVLSSTNEIKSRGAFIIGISDLKNDLYDVFIELPKLERYLYPIVEIIPLQMMSYYLAVQKQLDPDYPRNLAKSVTVK
ncbi:glutamine--fructose-6-phosphate transaminase (isomerizing) [Candidatus Nitrosocosmicus franklandus]|uniref:Glutamine--fructose-6-phosphate aminotransferase [isomerizing] n=1 Tax=Candidatus Nitrosocosmicus franklandianus TaxID=1798806 RepID=A0A484I727_9ARCH|nr:glutamine--fructose-6-phosphate transaminase (isomerizing) [Candidatus Nitrosocosmicus franklandus]VFJ12981.1 Glutamine--fructose-6-phosphate aminotransferase [isomerizing] [Candidatus Nitrosocosmicus franklandus]